MKNLLKTGLPLCATIALTGCNSLENLNDSTHTKLPIYEEIYLSTKKLLAENPDITDSSVICKVVLDYNTIENSDRILNSTYGQICIDSYKKTESQTNIERLISNVYIRDTALCLFGKNIGLKAKEDKLFCYQQSEELAKLFGDDYSTPIDILNAEVEHRKSINKIRSQEVGNLDEYFKANKLSYD